MYEMKKHLCEFLENISNGCFNFMRKNIEGENNGRSTYDLEFKIYHQNQLIKRTVFRFVKVDNYSEDPVVLYKKCYQFLKNTDTKYDRSFKYSWPSFV